MRWGGRKNLFSRIATHYKNSYWFVFYYEFSVLCSFMNYYFFYCLVNHFPIQFPFVIFGISINKNFPFNCPIFVTRPVWCRIIVIIIIFTITIKLYSRCEDIAKTILVYFVMFVVHLLPKLRNVSSQLESRSTSCNLDDISGKKIKVGRHISSTQFVPMF